MSDNVNRGLTFYYWVTSVNTKGLESVKEAANNTTTSFPPSYTQSNLVSGRTAVTAALTSGSTLTSAYQVGNSGVIPGYINFDVIVTSPSTNTIFDCLLWASNTSSKPNGYIFRFDNRNGNNAGQILKVTSGAWTNIGTAQAAANASQLPVGTYHVFCEVLNGGFMNIYVNGVWQTSVTDTTYTPSGALYFGYELNANAVAPYILNQSLFTSGELLSQGSISTASLNTFSYTSTTVSIKWTWSAFDIYNPDGTTIAVPANSGGTTFSGLTSSTTYYFGFYVNIASGTCTVVKSDQSSGTADFSAQYITQTLNGDGNTALYYNMAAATTSSGGGGGSGGGYGGGGCFSGNVGVKTPEGFAKFEELPRSSTFYIENKTGVYPARLIVHENYHEVMLDMGNDELVTMGHAIKNAEGKDVPAIDVFPNAPRVDFTGTVYNLEVFGPDHHYILENGVEAHNFKLP